MACKINSNSAKELYGNGTRVELVKMGEPYTKMEPGEQGMIIGIEDTIIHVRWDNGMILDLEYGFDEIKIVV